MRTSTAAIGLTIALLISRESAAWAGADAVVFALKRGEAGLSVERITVADGETQIIRCGGDQPYIDVICPPAPGGSGSLAQAKMARIVALRNVGGILTMIDNPGPQQRERPVLADRRDYDIRVCTTSHKSEQQAFVIYGYEKCEPDTVGPVIDMFAGQIPLQPGDYVVCTDTVRSRHKQRVYGSAETEFDRYLWVRGEFLGKAGDFIIDLAGGQTIVDRSALPEGTAIRELQAAEYSSKGKRLLRYEPEGATGKVQSIVGEATIPSLKFGSIEFKEAPVAVIQGLPQFGARKAAGILGIDLLRQAEYLALVYPKPGERVGALRMTRQSTARPGDPPVPFTTVRTHPMIRADIGGQRVSLILDSGSPVTILDRQAAKAANVAGDAVAKKLGGLDRGAETMQKGAATITIGPRQIERAEVLIGDLPVFKPMRTHGQCVGLLGNAELSQLSYVELDFTSRALRFGKQ